MESYRKARKESSSNGTVLLFVMPPYITLPLNEGKRGVIFRRFRKYEEMILPHLSPESQMDIICKARVFECLTFNGSVYPPSLQSEMRAMYGKRLDVREFVNACKIATDCCK
ncbi:MAG: hypothetical protein NUV61_04275 [Candidatus Azambacteria bacterium]|nr:hypothetical protein [Candidatus Azambacteria bacterium]